MLAFLHTLFPRPIRASLYAAGIAADGSLIVSGDLPGWSAAVAAPLLLALLHLTPADVGTETPADPAPGQD